MIIILIKLISNLSLMNKQIQYSPFLYIRAETCMMEYTFFFGIKVQSCLVLCQMCNVHITTIQMQLHISLARIPNTVVSVVFLNLFI